MAGVGGDTAPPPAANGGEFLLSLLQKKPHHHFHQPTPSPQQQQVPALDPAVAASGSTVAFPGGPWLSNSIPWPHTLSPSLPYTPNFSEFQHANRFSPDQCVGSKFQFQGNQFAGNEGDDFRRLGFQGAEVVGGNVMHNLLQQKPTLQPQEHKLMFGSLPFEIQNHESLFNGNRQLDSQVTSNLNSYSNYSNVFQPGISGSRQQQELGGRGWGQQQPTLAPQTRQPPPGFPSKSGGGRIWDTFERSRGLQGNVDRKNGWFGDLGNSGGSISNGDDKLGTFFTEDSRMQRNNMAAQSGDSRPQHDHPDSHNLKPVIVRVDNGNQHQDRGVDEMRKEGRSDYDGGSHELDDLGEEIVDLLLLDDESNEKSEKKKNQNTREKDFRSDSRGQCLLSQRMRNFKRMMGCRNDIYKLNAHFLAIHESLIPPEEEKAKQRQLLTLLEKLVAKEWPHARLYLYGSCASTFGVCKSDIDVCLAIDDADINKSDVIVKLAEILESDNLEIVQALARARVPVVKLMDPVTEISCDICINNVLAVVNTKLLRDYAQIDARLHQLAFIVKHWAKSRGVNETYRGTLSSYAYVVMCIHFLQLRRPPILPCLQEMETTYSVTVDDKRCAFFDKVGNLRDFGSRNRESIAQLVWGFFNYWAYCHDYSNDVISIRTGSMISKRAKDWTRRVGNDRHLICIEDPFDITHDLGRVVDKYSIKVLREEFERAADIMQHDPNPCTSLFERYAV